MIGGRLLRFAKAAIQTALPIRNSGFDKHHGFANSSVSIVFPRQNTKTSRLVKDLALDSARPNGIFYADGFCAGR